jgi:hypothetical protein
VIGHLGPRISALLDGQLSPAEEERAWDHVHSCHQCRDAVEREGWVKTRLASMQFAGSHAPSSLRGSLLFSGLVDGLAAVLDDELSAAGSARSRLHLGLVGISSGAVGAAVMGVLALGASPANAPGVFDRTGSGPTSNPFSTVSAVIDRDRGSTGRQSRHEGRPPLAPSSARRLTP